MQNPITKVISMIEKQYLSWLTSEEQTKEIECQVEGVALKIILSRGRFIYPQHFSTPGVIENTINIASIDNRIKNLFDCALFKTDRDCYCFREGESNKFQLRFFSDESLIRMTLEKEEIDNAPYKQPSCTIS